MPNSVFIRLGRLLLRVALAYVFLLALWVVAAPQYHLLLGRGAALLIPSVVDGNVDRVWIAEGGLRMTATFTDRNTGFHMSASQHVTGSSRIDIIQYGYPIITFLALALGLPGLPLKKRLVRILIGAAVLFWIYAFLVMVAFYQTLASEPAQFLRNNWVLGLLPPATYASLKVPAFVLLGQVLPIVTFGALLFRPSSIGQPSRIRSQPKVAAGLSGSRKT